MERQHTVTQVSKHYDVARLKAILDIPEDLEDRFIKRTKEWIKDTFRCVVLIGSTGSGKSATCNTICGTSNKFSVSDSMNSHTYETKGILAKWFGQEENENIFVVDTPGLGDSQGRDTAHIAEMVTALQSIEYVHSFIIVLNS